MEKKKPGCWEGNDHVFFFLSLEHSMQLSHSIRSHFVDVSHVPACMHLSIHLSICWSVCLCRPVIDIGTQGFFSSPVLLPCISSHFCAPLPACLSVCLFQTSISSSDTQYSSLFFFSATQCYATLCYTMQISQLFFFKAWLYSTACHINT